MSLRSSFGFALLVGSLFLTGRVIVAHDDHEGDHEGHGDGEHNRSARLTPPDGAPFPDARGRVSLTSEFFRVQVEGLATGDYSVLLDDGKGTMTAIGTITVTEEADDDDHDHDHEGEGDGARHGDDGDDDDDDGDEVDTEGVLKLSGTGLPFGAASPRDLAGRAISVNDKDGKIVLQGTTPTPIVDEPDEKTGRCPLSRPDPAVDPDAEGVIRLESGGGRIVIKVRLENLDAGKVYEVILSKPDNSASESLGKVTINDEGNGQLKIDSKKGDAIPFGAGDLKALEGFGVKVNNPDGATVLVGKICPAKVDDDDDDEGEEHEGEGEGERECESALARPDPAVDADATGKVELESKEGGELEVKVRHLEAAATYDVVLTDPAPGGASESIGNITTSAEGRGKLELEGEHGDKVPFGKANFTDLAGFAVSVKDKDGKVVLQGTVPTLDCPGEDEGDDDDEHEGDRDGDGEHGILLGLAVEPMFLMTGEFDAPFLRGDTNHDELIDISDAVSILIYLFVGGARPYCLDAADANDDGKMDIGDSISILRFLFLSGSAPSDPGMMIPGTDPTADNLYCEETEA
jgi:hypothetical protein